MAFSEKCKICGAHWGLKWPPIHSAPRKSFLFSLLTSPGNELGRSRKAVEIFQRTRNEPGFPLNYEKDLRI